MHTQQAISKYCNEVRYDMALHLRDAPGCAPSLRCHLLADDNKKLTVTMSYYKLPPAAK